MFAGKLRVANYMLNCVLRHDPKLCQVCIASLHADAAAGQPLNVASGRRSNGNGNDSDRNRNSTYTNQQLRGRRAFSSSHSSKQQLASCKTRHLLAGSSPDGRAGDAGGGGGGSHQIQLVRFASTKASSTPTAAAAPNSFVANLKKRDASTQAQQQAACVVEQTQNVQDTSTFRASDLMIFKCSPNELGRKPHPEELIFGHTFTDHMLRVDWDCDNGWSAPLISKLHNFEMHPGAKVIHYAQAAFEGAKAHRGYDNKIRFFRLEQNARRLLLSARRLALPEFDEDELIKCIHKLVQLDQSWIPEARNQQSQMTSLYVRPTIMGIEPSLGVASSRKAMLYVLLSPVGPYFKTGFKPVSLYADPKFVRAWPGGAGNAKLGSNYAPTIMVQKQAEKFGAQQVLWLYGDDMKLTEVGTMNVFATVRGNSDNKVHLITPPLSDGLILPGITRASILELASQWPDVICEERYLTIGELQQLLHENRLVEMFGSGTACVVCPISSIHLKDGSRLEIPFSDVTKPLAKIQSDNVSAIDELSSLSLTRRILKAIKDIQYGQVAHHWAKELMSN